MKPDLHCPECGSTKFMAVPGSQAFLCCDCKHEFTPARAVAPLRIFLSYGHDENEELVATRLPDCRKLLLTLPEIAELDWKDAAELLDYLLANPLRSVIHGGRDRYLIVIDDLDEACEAGRNPLVEMLARNAQRLPDWLAREHVYGNN